MRLTAKRVLVVEDEALVRLILVETLADEGYEVIEARTGDDAVRLIEDGGAFDIVVTDIQMPGRLNGIEVGRRVRAANPRIPIVYVTGRPDNITKLGEFGPHDVLLRKPYGPRDVLSIISRLVG